MMYTCGLVCTGRAREKFGLGIQDPRLGPCRGATLLARDLRKDLRKDLRIKSSVWGRSQKTTVQLCLTSVGLVNVRLTFLLRILPAAGSAVTSYYTIFQRC